MIISRTSRFLNPLFIIYPVRPRRKDTFFFYLKELNPQMNHDQYTAILRSISLLLFKYIPKYGDWLMHDLSKTMITAACQNNVRRIMVSMVKITVSEWAIFNRLTQMHPSKLFFLNKINLVWKVTDENIELSNTIQISSTNYNYLSLKIFIFFPIVIFLLVSLLLVWFRFLPPVFSMIFPFFPSFLSVFISFFFSFSFLRFS